MHKTSHDTSSCRSLWFLFVTHILFADANGTLIWEKPSIVGKFDASCDCYRSTSRGWNNFISHSQMRRRSFLKNDDLIIFAEFHGKDPLPNYPHKNKPMILSISFHTFK